MVRLRWLLLLISSVLLPCRSRPAAFPSYADYLSLYSEKSHSSSSLALYNERASELERRQRDESGGCSYEATFFSDLSDDDIKKRFNELVKTLHDTIEEVEKELEEEEEEEEKKKNSVSSWSSSAVNDRLGDVLDYSTDLNPSGRACTVPSMNQGERCANSTSHR